jgi:parallel beta-helix repeat protein
MAMVALGGTAEAAACGGAIACKCGDTVTTNTTLTKDIGICPGIGLRVRSGVVLDCAGHAITGNNTSAAKYGVFIENQTNAEVRSCRVSAFRRGIRVYGGSGNRVTSNESWANTYGVELAGGTKATQVVGNNVHDNRDEGIHVGAGANDTVVRNNTVTKSKNENIYVLSSDRVQVVGNTSTGTQRPAIFVKHSHGSYVADNTCVNGPIHVRGDSVDNTFSNNSLRGNGYFFEAYQEATGVWTFPHDNTVLGGKVENTTTCLRFAGAYDNTVQDLMLDNECQVTMWSLGGHEASGNVIHTIPLPGG